MSGSWAGTCTYPFLVIVIPATLAHVVAGKVLLGDACLEVDRGLQAVAGLEGLGDCGDGVVEVVSRSVAVAFPVEGVDSYRHRAVPVAAAAGTFGSKLYFVFGTASNRIRSR